MNHLPTLLLILIVCDDLFICIYPTNWGVRGAVGAENTHFVDHIIILLLFLFDAQSDRWLLWYALHGAGRHHFPTEVLGLNKAARGVRWLNFRQESRARANVLIRCDGRLGYPLLGFFLLNGRKAWFFGRLDWNGFTDVLNTLPHGLANWDYIIVLVNTRLRLGDSLIILISLQDALKHFITNYLVLSMNIYFAIWRISSHNTPIRVIDCPESLRIFI